MSNISIKHVLAALGIGIAAGFMIVILDQYVVSKIETAIGLTPSTA